MVLRSCVANTTLTRQLHRHDLAMMMTMNLIRCQQTLVGFDLLQHSTTKDTSRSVSTFHLSVHCSRPISTFWECFTEKSRSYG